ncbi:hypothetical protein RND81_09G257400 [Saponaria officinalis]|uniref:Uncharacterized protein n=1 Tax=Saponaria officinalis TaxID=3572 RepID=A0AAW1IRP1_SAPOF
MSIPGMKIGSGWRRFLFLLLVMIFVLYLLSVLELRKLSTFVYQPKKPDHLVLGPAAGQGLQNRLQCHGTKSLNKIHRVASQSLKSRKNVAFVTVFTIYNSSSESHKDKFSESVTVGNISYTKLERSIAILDSFIKFIKVTMPLSNIIILTDPESDFRIDRERVTTYPIQGDYSRDKLMLQRIRSYIAFLTARLEENNKDQPLNSGFIAVRGTAEGLKRAKEFLNEVLKAYTEKYMKASKMLGDQLALAWVVRSHPSFDSRKFSKPVAFMEDYDGASVLFLPCAIYNWTPPEGAGQYHGMPLDVKVVHFKGSRKRLMLEAWNFFNSSSNMDDMLCLILSSGRTKYDF